MALKLVRPAFLLSIPNHRQVLPVGRPLGRPRQEGESEVQYRPNVGAVGRHGQQAQADLLPAGIRIDPRETGQVRDTPPVRRPRGIEVMVRVCGQPAHARVIERNGHEFETETLLPIAGVHQVTGCRLKILGKNAALGVDNAHPVRGHGKGRPRVAQAVGEPRDPRNRPEPPPVRGDAVDVPAVREVHLGAVRTPGHNLKVRHRAPERNGTGILQPPRPCTAWHSPNVSVPTPITISSASTKTYSTRGVGVGATGVGVGWADSRVGVGSAASGVGVGVTTRRGVGVDRTAVRVGVAGATVDVGVGRATLGVGIGTSTRGVCVSAAAVAVGVGARVPAEPTSSRLGSQPLAPHTPTRISSPISATAHRLGNLPATPAPFIAADTARIAP